MKKVPSTVASVSSRHDSLLAWVNSLRRLAAIGFLAGAVICIASTSLRAQTADLRALAAELNVQPQSLSVSGVSSGAFMAQQFHVAYSQWVIGAGIVAGGPSGCAQHQAHGTPTIVGPITNSIAWGVDYCTSFSAKSAQAYGIDWLTELVGSNYYLISDNPFSTRGKCPTTRYSLRVPLDELDDETSLFDPRNASLPACPEPTCTSEGGREGVRPFV